MTKMTPIRSIGRQFGEEPVEDFYEISDNTVAVLSDGQIDEWMIVFDGIIYDPDLDDCDEGYAVTEVFDIDGEKLVIVADSGMVTGANDKFEMFCNQRDIPCQPIVDSLDCTDVDVEDIYTGAMDDNPDLLALVHRLYN
jgi:hypothetical protein